MICTSPKEQSVMQGKNNTLQQLLKYIPRNKFGEIVEKYNGNKWCKGFFCWDLFIALLHGQFNSEDSLRSVNLSNQYQSNHLSKLGVKSPTRSTLSDACRWRNPAIFMEIYKYLVSTLKQANKISVSLDNFTYLIDSTPIFLKGWGYEWAKNNYRITGLKVHTVYDLNLSSPVHFTITAPNINDVTEGKKIRIKSKSTYVFDKAYYDYTWWNRIDKKGSRFVTRVKKNTPFKIKERRKVAEENILHDWTIQLSGGKAKKFDGMLRHIRVRLDSNKNKSISIITNDLKSPAKTIGDFYKSRWEIELFFKCLKQNLKIKRFWGRSENAVKIQIIIAMIGYILLKLVQINTKSHLSVSHIRIIIRIKLYEKVELDQIMRPPQWRARV